MEKADEGRGLVEFDDATTGERAEIVVGDGGLEKLGGDHSGGFKAPGCWISVPSLHCQVSLEGKDLQEGT